MLLRQVTTEYETVVFDNISATEKTPFLLTNGILMTIVAEAVLLIAILMGNGFVAVVVIRTPSIQSDQSYLMMSLTASDILSGLSIVFVLLTLIEERLTLTICKWRFMTLVMWWMASIYTLLAITLDRFIAITKPLYHRKIVTKNILFVVIAMVWVHSLGVGFCTFRRFDIKALKYCDLFFNVPQIYTKYFVWNFFVVLVIIVACYFKIFLVARTQACKTTPKPKSVVLWLNTLKNLKCARTLILVIGSLMICWAPLLIVLTIELNRGDSTKLQTARLVAYFLSQSGSLFNPLVYSCRNSEFCTAAKKIFRRRKRGGRQIQVVSTVFS